MTLIPQEHIPKPPWIMHKFGGTSLANAERYKNVSRILDTRGEAKCAVVVSAMGGMTDALVELVHLASTQHASYTQKLELLHERQRHVVTELIGDGPTREALLGTITKDVEDISDLLRASWLMRSFARTTMELVSGYGELWSAQVLHTLLQAQGHKACWMDARDILVVEPTDEGTPHLLLEASGQNLALWHTQHHGEDTRFLIITGFIASTPDGLPTTLGRNGSDYSASIFSALLDAHKLFIWTDVDGVLSANPNLVPEAVVLDTLSYKEAMELAYFGAKVLHPSTMAPAVRHDVVITIKNTFAPAVPGTVIRGMGTSKFMIKGFATIDNMALINLEGSHMIGVPGIASRLFGALRDAGISVVMISQASSEHSICFVISEAHSIRAKEVIEHAFFAERHQGHLQSLEITPSCSILAAVGDEMAGQIGVASRFFQALGNAQVNIRAIAQGSSERNISVVIDSAHATRALRAVHSGFYLSHQTLSIGVIGAGVVGSALLDQLATQAQALRDRFNVDLRVRAIATTSHMLLHDHSIDLTQWRDVLRTPHHTCNNVDLSTLLEHIDTDYLPHTVLIDCTADAQVADLYHTWLERGVHIITPNKKANTREHAYWSSLRDARKNGVHYLYETTVGAGLPIIHTLRDLIDTGDRITRIEGIFSGTLSYLFNTYNGEKPFSQLVLEARTHGYTEPDPRDDLSGTDVARKVVILAREMGLELELEQVAITNLVPEPLRHVSLEVFLARLPEFDEAMRALFTSAQDEGCVLRFVGSIDAHGKARVALERCANNDALAHTRHTDNIVQFTTERYATNPLVVQGPGAGPHVTAAGVFSDLLRLASYLGVSR